MLVCAITPILRLERDNDVQLLALSPNSVLVW